MSIDRMIQEQSVELMKARVRIAELERELADVLPLNIEGAHRLMDERDALRAALERLHELVLKCDRADVFRGAWAVYVEEACTESRDALALGTGSKALVNQPSTTSGLTDLLTDLLDYFEPKIDAEVEGDKWNAQTINNKEMDFYMRIKEVRGER